MRILPHPQFSDLMTRAIEAGAKAEFAGYRWDLHGACSNPYRVELMCSRSLRDGLLALITPCRECQHCLKRRSREWAARAGREYAAHPRTWFATFTIAPLHRAELLTKCSGLTDRSLRLALVRESGQWISLYLKRVRKLEAIRYMAVPELHRNGMVHWHALIHSNARWRSLANPWTWGFTKINLVKDGVREIRYVTKYLAKAKLGRVRASVGYGNQRPIGDSPPGASPIVAAEGDVLSGSTSIEREDDGLIKLLDKLVADGFLSSYDISDPVATG